MNYLQNEMTKYKYLMLKNLITKKLSLLVRDRNPNQNQGSEANKKDNLKPIF